MLFLVGVLTFSFLGSDVQGMDCYVCASDPGGACASPSSADGVVVSTQTCDGGSCMLYQTSDGYVRGCSPIQLGEGCVSGQYNGYSAEICACNSHLCNKSVRMSPSALTYITVLAISLAYKYFN